MILYFFYKFFKKANNNTKFVFSLDIISTKIKNLS